MDEYYGYHCILEDIGTAATFCTEGECIRAAKEYKVVNSYFHVTEYPGRRCREEYDLKTRKLFCREIELFDPKALEFLYGSAEKYDRETSQLIYRCVERYKAHRLLYRRIERYDPKTGKMLIVDK